MKDVFIVEQFLDGAVGLAEQIFDRRAAMLAVGLPEVTVEESADRDKE